MARRGYSNVASPLVTAGTLNNSDTTSTFSVTTTPNGWPAAPFFAALDLGTSSEELVLVTALAGTSFTVTRGGSLSTPYGAVTKSHASGATLKHVAGAPDFDEANAHVNTSAGVHGVAGTLVGTSDTQTLSNKTLVTPLGAPFPIAFHFATPTVGLQIPKFVATRNCVLRSSRHMLDSGTGTTYRIYVAGTSPTGMIDSSAVASTGTGFHDFVDVSVTAGQQIQVYIVNAGTSALGLSVTVDAETA